MGKIKVLNKHINQVISRSQTRLDYKDQIHKDFAGYKTLVNLARFQKEKYAYICMC